MFKIISGLDNKIILPKLSYSRTADLKVTY